MDAERGWLRIEPGEEEGTFVLTGELYMATARQVDALREHAEKADGPITLEVGGVTFLDSTGISAIVGLAGCLQGHRLAIANPSELTRRILDLVGVSQIPTIMIEG